MLFGAAIGPASAVDAPASDPRKSAETAYFDPDDSEFVKKFLKPGSFMRVSEVKPGMEGYGLSVFHGTKIERFNVKVIGVMKRVNKGKDAILVRMSGPMIGKNNVIRGMSGSPIYINERLVGSISYGFDFSMEPIAGVTPIVDMLDAMARSKDAPKIGSRLNVPRSLPLSPSVVSTLPGELGKFRKNLISSASPRMVPLISPVSLSGFSPRAQEFLRSRFETIGLSVSEGAGGGTDSSVSPEDAKEANQLKPGSAVGVLLTTGDFESASTGTVTANFDGKIIGFGHPFVEAGQVDFPMASGYILDVLPSLSISFKLSAPIAVLGHVFSDRPWSIGGQMGGKARMLPVNIEVTDSERQIRKKFSSRVIDHEDLTPELVAACAMSAVDATYQSSAPYVARMETNVQIENAQPIKRFDCLTNSYGSSGSSSIFRPFFSDPVSGSIHSIASRVLSNRYKKVRLKSVDLKISLETGRDLTRIVRVSTDRPVVKPGEKVTLSCLLEPYDGETYTETIDVTIPRSVPDGDLALGVSGGSQLEDLRKRMNLIDPPTTSLEQIVRRIQDRPRGDRLFAVLALPNQAIHVDGEVVESPPGHWNKLFFSNRYTHGPSLVNGERRMSKELSSLVEGTHIVAVKVKRSDPYLEKQPWYVASAAGSGKASMGAYVTTQAQKAIDSLNKTDSKSKTDSTAAADAGSAKGSGLTLWTPLTDETHIRPVQVWSQTDDSAFKGGTRDGIIVDSWGRMFPGFKETTVVPLNTLRAWSAVWSKGAIYIGGTNKVYKWTPGSSACEEVAKFENSVAVPALAADSKGRIYASVAPGGRVVALDGSKVTEVAKLSEPLVTSLVVDDEDTLYAGVTDSGKIYKLTAGGAPVALADTGDAHVLSMFFDKPTGRIYVGCGEDGNVYSVSKTGQLRAEYHSDEHLVTGVCKSKGGDLFITTAGTGRLVRICTTGETFDLATSEAFYTLFYHKETDSIFAGDAEGDITQIQEEPLTKQSFFVPVKHTEQEAVIGLCADGGNQVFAISSNLPSVLGFAVKPDSAVFTSPVKDASRNAHWSMLRVYGSFNEVRSDLEKAVAVETRAGETVRPDHTWGAWTPAVNTSEGYLIKSKDSRYLQYRLRWLGGLGSDLDGTFPAGRDSVIGRVTVTFLPTNIRPRFSTVSLRAGTYINDSEEVTVVGSDPDGDTLSLAIDSSDDNGKTWKMLKPDLRAERSKKSTEKKEPEKAKTSEAKADDAKQDTTGDQTKKETSADKPPGESGTVGGGDSSDDDDSDSTKKQGEAKPPSEDDGDDKPSGSGSPDDGDSSGTMSFDSPRVNLQESPNEPEKPSPPPDGNPDEKKPDEKPDGEKKPGDKPDRKRPEEPRTPGEPGKPAEPSKPGDKKGEPKKGDKKKPVKKAITTQPPTKTAAGAKKPAVDPSDLTDKFVWPLMANTFKEGHHIIRFSLSDAPSNVVQPEEIKCYRYVIIDRTKPVISKADATVSSDNKLSLDVVAKDAISPIANATFTVNGEEPRAFAVVDGLADTRDAHLTAAGVELKKGAHKVEIEISDRSGNKVTKTLKLSTR